MLWELMIEQELAFRWRHRAIDWLFGDSLQVFGCDFHGQHAQMVKGLRVHLQCRWVMRCCECTQKTCVFRKISRTQRIDVLSCVINTCYTNRKMLFLAAL